MNGVELIAQERQKQIEQDGWSANHDDAHDRFQLSDAAMAYLNPSNSDHIRRFWPWDWKWWKPARGNSINDRYEIYHIRDLVKAGALIAAEIDRLQRLNKKKANDGSHCTCDVQYWDNGNSLCYVCGLSKATSVGRSPKG